MKFLDLFSGIGGFRLGMERNGYESVGYIEKDKFARKSYEVIFDVKSEWNGKDVQEIRSEEIPDFDILCAGFPCPDFSMAGSRKGLEGTKGSLFYTIGRIAKVKRPDYLFLENVQGLLSHDGGRTFKKVLQSLGQLGYYVEFEVLNSKDFGVPQRRKRVYIIGHFGKKPRRTVFPIKRKTGKSCERVGRVKGVSGYDILKRVYSSNGVSPVIDSMNGGNREPFVLDHDKVKIRKVSTCVDGHYYKGLDNHGQRTGVIGARPVKLANSGMNGRRVKGKNDPMFSICATADNAVMRDKRVRKLTPKECWRLQGFPDWTYNRAKVVNSPTQLYKQAGRAVTVNVVEAIANNLLED